MATDKKPSDQWRDPSRVQRDLLDQLAQIPDPRRIKSVSYPIEEILFISVCAMLSGAEDFTEFELFGKARGQWLAKFLKLENGVPSHDTFRRVFSLIEPKVFNEFFIKWTGGLCRKDGQEIVAIDGKTLKGSGGSKQAVHIVNAWATENQVTLGQLQTEAKSNEITAIPELLSQLKLKDSIVTIDAMGTQKDIASVIDQSKAHYVLCLKKNHPELYQEVKSYLDDEEFLKEMPSLQHVDGDHGRIETRTYWVSDRIDWMEAKPQWAGLKTIGKVQRIRELPGQSPTTQTAYFLCSIDPDAELFARSVRSHWGVENQLHWVLDVAFREDDCQVRDRCAATNLSLMRKLALNLLRKNPGPGGFQKKRKLASWSLEFLDSLVNPTHA